MVTNVEGSVVSLYMTAVNVFFYILYMQNDTGLPPSCYAE